MLSIISGLIVGGFLGWALQRGGFCMNTAFRSILFREDRSILRAWVLVLLINIPALSLLEQLGILYAARAPFVPWALIVGSLIFGAGMVWGGGCVSGSYYRASKGVLGSFFALFGFAAGAIAVNTGALSFVRNLLSAQEFTAYGEIPTLFNLGFADAWLIRWVIVGFLEIAGVAFLLRAPKVRFNVGWNWQLTGAVVGILSLAAWIFSSMEGRDYGLSMVQPTVALGSWFLSGESGGINWTSWMLIAFPGGAFLAAWKGNDLKLRLPSPSRILIQFFGGLAMGFGAALAGGCNIGHGVTGLSTMAISSIVATVFTLLGNWGITALVWRQARRQAAS